MHFEPAHAALPQFRFLLPLLGFLLEPPSLASPTPIRWFQAACWSRHKPRGSHFALQHAQHDIAWSTWTAAAGDPPWKESLPGDRDGERACQLSARSAGVHHVESRVPNLALSTHHSDTAPEQQSMGAKVPIFQATIPWRHLSPPLAPSPYPFPPSCVPVLQILVDTYLRNSGWKGYQSAVMPSDDVTARSATTCECVRWSPCTPAPQHSAAPGWSARLT